MKKILSLILLALLPIVTNAYDAKIDGIYYNFSGNEATVTYEEMYIYTTPDQGRRFYRAKSDYKGNVVIPEAIVYKGNTYIVTAIGEKAFEDTDVSSISIPKSVTSISTAFFGCSVSTIYCYAMTTPNMSGFNTASIDGVVPSRNGKDASEIKLYIPEDAVEQYRNHPVWGRFDIEVLQTTPIIHFADALVKEICVANWDTNGDGELSEKEAAAVAEIGRTFKDKYITSFNELRYFTGLNSIFPDAFSECSRLKSINIPNSVTSISEKAFYGCSSLSSVTIPNSVTHIYSFAFQNCKGLTSFIIGNSVTYISNTVFYGCNSLKKIIWLTTTPPSGYEYANLDGVINYVTNEQYTELNNKVVYPFLSSMFEVDGIIYVPVNPSERTCDAIDCVYDETSANTKIPLSVSYKGITMNVQKVQPYICYNNRYIDSLYCEYNGNIETYSFFGCTDIKNIVCNINGEIEQEAFKGLSNLMSLSLGSQLNSIGKEAFSGCTSLTEIVSKAVNPPSCGEFAFHEINVWSCKLIVPKGSMASYREADQWKEFFFIEEDTGSDVIPDPEKKCAIPTISYKNGQLSFECETEGVEFKSSIRDTDIKDYSASVINLSATYTITVYATKDGYENSEVATGTLCWIDVAPETEGIVNEDAVMVVKAMPVLIQTQGGTISIQGAAEGTPISVYDIEGKQYGSTIAEKDRATISTSLRPGSIAIVKIGEKAVKIAIKE